MIDPSAVFSIKNEEDFESQALALFRFQAEHCPPYRQYLELLGVDPATVHRSEAIPFLPIEFFKSHPVYIGQREPETVFTSSGTTGQTPSRHPVRSLAIYERSFTEGFERFYSDPARYAIFALLPNYLERSGSSLVYMADRLIARAGAGGFYLDQHESLIEDMHAAAQKGKQILLLGVSFALWELAEKGRLSIPGLTVMETGGMKGRREEITREQLHSILGEAFGVDAIHSEYGMTELLSQAYSSGNGIFRCPPWMKVLIRDFHDPFETLPAGRTGGVNVIDLANGYSCAFIETGDLGSTDPDGSFRILGRIDYSEIRGCNLMVAG